MGNLREVNPNTEDLNVLDAEVKAKNPGVQLYHMAVPRVGNFYIRGQNQADVKASSKEVEAYVSKKIAELGGEEALKKLPVEEQTRISRDVDVEAGDISNTVTLKRCVIYPYDFAKQFDEDRIMSGVIPLLIDKIMEISGWMEVELREV
jgi:hypothetical protein